MLEIDRPFDGLDEVWIWPVPSDDVVTRLGRREAGALVGHVEIASRPQRLAGGRRHELDGLGAWQRAKLGTVHFPHTDIPGPPGEATVTCGRVKASWTAGGTFRVGDHAEDNRIATGGRPIQPGLLGLGRSLVRRVRKQEPEPDEAGTELRAFDGWLVATPVATDEFVAWRVRVDRHPGAPESVGLGLVVAAIGLVHHQQLH